MHVASFEKMKAFLAAYSDDFPTENGRSRILEVGSKKYREQDTYRALVDEQRQTYTGLDLEAGDNVDIVPANAYVWDEIQDDSFDVCISGQTFEHNPFFWVTTCEIARVLVPGGYVCIIAPGGGSVHRYPVDCYRFYPDSWSAVAALAGLEIVEVYFETNDAALNVPGGHWRDSMMIARKPMGSVNDENSKRRAQVVRPFREGFGAFAAIGHQQGPAVSGYLASLQSHPVRRLLAKVARRISPYAVIPIYRA